MTNEERFKENLQKWSPLNMEAARRLTTLECKNVLVCHNEDGQLNLKKSSETTVEYFHSTISPLREAQQWFLSLDLKDKFVLYVYGIGVGYYYDVISEWLKEDNKRFIVFLEDDLEVIHHFLETERATEFLKDPQAKLFHFSWETCHFSFASITTLFALAPFKVSALKLYEKMDPKHNIEFRARISFFHDLQLSACAEFLGLSAGGFLANYYNNLLELPYSKLEFKMRDQFKDIPAIICGAGPSLGKNIHLLKQLKDKALIMAGGTAMNVLNGVGIMPHFGLGIDPNPAHYNRLIANSAFEEPFFYRQRMYNPALKMIHGERIIVTGAGGYVLPSWFEEKLGIPKVKVIEEGHNVVNFNLSIAKELGCNPIILVGVDLAYSDNLSYAPGLVRHAIQDPKEAFLTKYSHEELLIINDIYGKPVNTLWKWINESLWFSQFASKNPELVLLNCTEGGIGFNRVPNLKLSEIAEKYLTQSYDFASLIHGEIQSCLMPETVTLEKIIENIQIFAKSLLSCEGYCGALMVEFGRLLQKISSEETVSTDYKTPTVEENLTKLEAEEGYKFHLQSYKQMFLDVFFPRLQVLESDENFYSQKEIVIKKINFDLNLYSFLSKVARNNINMIGKTLTDFVNKSQKPSVQPTKRALNLQQKLKAEREEAQKNEVYTFQDNRLILRDSELDLNYQGECLCDLHQNFYSNDSLKSEVYKCAGKLHGPSSYYGENGQILAKNWYIDGHLEGKGWFYYPTGELYALKRYKKGLLNGLQEYYYRNGLPKSILYYKEDLLENEMVLFYENGKLKREIHFLNGKKDGRERLWDKDGQLMLEAHYKMDVPVGTAREWYDNGNLAKEIVYKEDSDEFDIKQWRESGAPISPEEMLIKDYFDIANVHSKSLNTSIHSIYQTLVNIMPSVPENKSEGQFTTIEQDMLALKQELDKLSHYNHEMLMMAGFEGKNPKEAVWKTPEVETMIKTQLEEMDKKLTEAASNTQTQLKDLIEKLNQKLKE